MTDIDSYIGNEQTGSKLSSLLLNLVQVPVKQVSEVIQVPIKYLWPYTVLIEAGEEDSILTAAHFQSLSGKDTLSGEATIISCCHPSEKRSTLKGKFVCVCVEALWPSQPNGVMSSMVNLPNHFYWAGLVL